MSSPPIQRAMSAHPLPWTSSATVIEIGDLTCSPCEGMASCEAVAARAATSIERGTMPQSTVVQSRDGARGKGVSSPSGASAGTTARSGKRSSNFLRTGSVKSMKASSIEAFSARFKTKTAETSWYGSEKDLIPVRTDVAVRTLLVEDFDHLLRLSPIGFETDLSTPGEGERSKSFSFPALLIHGRFQMRTL